LNAHWNQPLKILILKPSSLGDVVQALPVLRLLKQQLPHSQIYWWVDSKLAPLLDGDPDLAGVVKFERRHWFTPSRWRRVWSSMVWIRAQAFDWVIDLQGLARSGFVTWVANGQLTVGLDDAREGANGFYDLRTRPSPFLTHAVDRYLGILPLLGLAVHHNFQWLPPRPAVAAALRRKWPVDGFRWLIVQPGARWLNKRWPDEYFAQTVRQLAAEHSDLRFAILGGNEDRPLGERIAGVLPDRCLDLTGALTLPEMVEWIRLSQLMVTNDTGPMHVAAALGKTVVAPFGPTEPCRTGPYGQLDHVLQLKLPCVPCLKSRCTYHQPMECLKALTPATLIPAARKLLAHGSSVGRVPPCPPL